MEEGDREVRPQLWGVECGSREDFDLKDKDTRVLEGRPARPVEAELQELVL